jgi:site-specific DNA-methyltransferase (adenine-specific)
MEGLEAQGVSVQERLDALYDAQLLYWPRAQKGSPRLKHSADRLQGASLPDVWTDIAPINSQAAERLGYSTHKPEALLEYILAASSNEGTIILDPFCGCGTTISVSHRRKWRWIGIDITHIAIGFIKSCLHDAH